MGPKFEYASDPSPRVSKGISDLRNFFANEQQTVGGLNRSLPVDLDTGPRHNPIY